MSATIRSLPHDAEAEKSLIGSLLLAPDTLSEVAHLVSPESFILSVAGNAFSAIQQLANAGIPVDAHIVLEQLRRTGAADDGTLGWLIEAMNATPHAAHAAIYAKHVAERHARRCLALLATEIGESSRDLTRPVADIVRVAGDGLAGLDVKPVAAKKRSGLEAWKPFPTEALPEPLRTFIDDSARAIGCDPAYVGLPVLVAAAAAIGLTFSLRMKNSWFVKPILWGCVVGKSGTAKTPAFDAAMTFTRERQAEARERHAAAMGQWQKDLDRFDSEHDKWESDGGGEDDEPQKPPRPTMERVLTTNVTIEALASLLDSTPKGLLVSVDELSGLIAGFDRYAAGKGGDAPQWLSCYNAGPIVIDRKTGEPRTLFIPHAAVSIVGTTQPATLSRVMGREHRDSGLLARILLVAPPSEPAVWSDADVSEATLVATRELFQRLFDLAPAADDFGKPTPNLVHKSAEAHREWVEFFNSHNERIAELDDEDLRASFKKLEEVAARIALVVHVVRLVSDDGVADPTHIDGDSMRAGITLAEWFVGETRRVYQIVGGESPGVSTRRRLLDWLAKRGGPVTVRDVYTNCRWLKEPDAAERALGELVGDGLGNWIEQPTGDRGGRPTRQFVLSAPAKPSGTRAIRGCADADNADLSADPEQWGAA